MSYLVGGVNLNGEVLMGVDKLDEQRKLIAKALIVGLADQTSLLALDNVVEVLALADGLATGNARDLPALGAPNQLFGERREFVIIHLQFMIYTY